MFWTHILAGRLPLEPSVTPRYTEDAVPVAEAVREFAKTRNVVGFNIMHTKAPVTEDCSSCRTPWPSRKYIPQGVQKYL